MLRLRGLATGKIGDAAYYDASAASKATVAPSAPRLPPRPPRLRV